MTIDQDELDYWVKEFPELEEQEIIDILEVFTEEPLLEKILDKVV